MPILIELPTLTLDRPLWVFVWMLLGRERGKFYILVWHIALVNPFRACFTNKISILPFSKVKSGKGRRRGTRRTRKKEVRYKENEIILDTLILPYISEKRRFFGSSWSYRVLAQPLHWIVSRVKKLY